jgi:branched-chain amino acid transport system permease protein
MSYYLVVLVTAVIFACATVSLNMVAGYAGQPNLGQSAIFGLGAYFAAVFATSYEVSFWWNLLVAGVVCGLAGAVVGAISLRLREDFFAITTVGLNFVVVAVFQTVPFFGGSSGIYSIPLPSLAGRSFGNVDFLVCGLVLLAGACLVSMVIYRSWFGGMLLAMREDELVAASMGAPVARFKALSFVISSVFAGLAGCLYAYFLSTVTPESFGFNQSVILLAMLIIGGTSTIRGAVFGAVLLTLIPEMFRFAADYRMLVFGLFLVLVLRFQPEGLIGERSWVARQSARLAGPAQRRAR